MGQSASLQVETARADKLLQERDRLRNERRVVVAERERLKEEMFVRECALAGVCVLGLGAAAYFQFVYTKTGRTARLLQKTEPLSQKIRALTVANEELAASNHGLKLEAEKAKKFGIEKFGRDLLDVADNLKRCNSSVEAGLREIFSEKARLLARVVNNNGGQERRSDGDLGENSFSGQGATEQDLPVEAGTAGNDSGLEKTADNDCEKLVHTLGEGVALTETCLISVLEKHGIQRFADDEVFDPHRHEAMYQVPDAEKNKIAVVERDGYMIQDRVLRPARVGVGSRD